MNQRALVARLLSPAGFVLVGLCFLLPFVVVSCTPNTGATMSATYTGVDLARGSRATVSATSTLQQTYTQVDGAALPTLADVRTRVRPIGVQPLILVAAILLVAGLAMAAVRSRIGRSVGSAAAAGCAAILLVAGEFAARRAARLRFNVDARDMIGSGRDTLSWLSIRAGVGFWISCVLVIVIAAGNLAGIVRATHRPPPELPPD